MQIFIKNIKDRKTFPIEITADDRVEEVKLAIEAAQGVAPGTELATRPALSFAPSDSSGDCLAVAEFCDRFDAAALGPAARGHPPGARLTLLELDAALAALPSPGPKSNFSVPF